MGVAKNNLGSHIYQFIYKEQTAFKHLLMYQTLPFALMAVTKTILIGSGSEAWPRGIGNGHYGAIHKGFHLV